MIGQDEIREIMDLTGLKQGPLAQRIGVTQPTVSRWLKAQNPSVPDPQQEEALRQLREEVLRGSGTGTKGSPFRLKSEGAANTSLAVPTKGLVPAQDQFTLPRVDGPVAAGIFRRVEFFNDHVGDVVSAPRDPEFPFARQVAFRVEGDSMNRADPKPINHGDFIICALWEDLDMIEEDGLNVVVEQTTEDGRLRERSVKELRVFEDRVEFHPRSSNPVHEPIVVPKNRDPAETQEVRIHALVRFVFDNHPIGRARARR